MLFTKFNLLNQIASLKEILQFNRSLKQVLKSKLARQTFILYVSQLLNLALGLIIVRIVTRDLGPENYGICSFTLAVTGFLGIFFEFGFFAASSRLLALARNEHDERRLMGSLIIITLGISIAFSAVIFILSFFIDKIFNTQINSILRFICILVSIYPFRYMLQQVCQGANKIGKMALHNAASILLYLGGLLIFVSLSELSIISVLLLNFISSIFVTIAILFTLKPTFESLLYYTKMIWNETKKYGFHVYTGRIAGMATYDSDKMLISYFANTTLVGFYSLAMTLTSPMLALSSSLADTFFKYLAHAEKIPKAFYYFNFFWLAGCCLVLSFSGKYIVLLFLSKEYSAVFPLLIVLTFANFFRGMTQPYNRFLGAKGQGKFLRNTAIVFTVCNLASNLILIPLFHAMGAAYASLLALILNYFIHVHYYRKYLTCLIKAK